MANFCPACGKRLNPRARFCSNCGKRIPIDNSYVSPTPGSSSASPAPGGGPAFPAPDPTPARRKKSGKRGGCLIPLVLLAGFVVTAFVTPGFLREPLEELDILGRFEKDEWDDLEKEDVKADDPLYQYHYDESTFAELPAETEDIQLRYSKEDLENAPVMTADVSISDPTAVLGDIRVDMKGWNLESEEDKLIVKELPELSEGEGGWSVKCYDFSLASGQHEFSSDVEITIPRAEGNDGAAGFIWFNEEAGRWEDAYSEPAPDGKSDIVFIDHFTLLGAKQYVFDPKKMELKESEGEKTFKLDSGILWEVYKPGKINMDSPVMIHRDNLFNMYKKISLEDVKKVDQTLQALNERSDEAEFYRGLQKPNIYLSRLFGAAGAVDNSTSLYKSFTGGSHSNIVSGFLACWDAVMIGCKVKEEALLGNEYYPEALKDSVSKNLPEITGLTISVVGVFCSNPIMAGVGLVTWLGPSLYNDLAGPGTWGKYVDPTVEDMYQIYYGETPGIRLDYGSKIVKGFYKKSYCYVKMRKPSTMEDSEFRELAAVVNKKGLGGRASGFRGFDEAYYKILTLYANQPERLGTILDDFLYNYAHAFWDMPDSAMDSYVKVVFNKTYPNGMPRISQQEKDKLCKKFVSEIRIGTKKQLLEALDRMAREGRKEFLKKAEKEFLPVMNTMLVFHVRDLSLQNGEPFQKSVYCKDWRSIKKNRKLLFQEGVLANDKRLRMTMRFGGKGEIEPQFLPLLESPLDNSKKHYYPYVPSFIPDPVEKAADCDIVYSCTYYHYLMMGAPDRIMFRPSGRWDKDVEELWGKIELPKMTGQKKVDVYVEVGERGLGKFEGYWKDTGGSGSTAGIGYNSEKFVAYVETEKSPANGKKEGKQKEGKRFEGKLYDGFEVDSYKADLKNGRLYLYSPGFKDGSLECRLEGPDTLVINNGEETYRYKRTDKGPPLSSFTEKCPEGSGGPVGPGVGKTVNTLTLGPKSNK